MTTTTRRRRKTAAERAEANQESLTRATSNTSVANYQAIFEHFSAAGITDIEPRVNILTYKAWQALGRQVRKGEKGCSGLTTWIPMGQPSEDADGNKKQRGRIVACATVFHISQTDPIPGMEQKAAPQPQTLESLIG